MLSKFDISEEIGRGEFSIVYKAQYKDDGKWVALKKVQVADKKDSNAILDCKKEINLLQRLDHPNVIKCLASFTHEKELYIVLELADAQDLSKIIKYYKEKKSFIPEKIIWEYFLQVCNAVRHMHINRIMHRDIKPENVFITRDDKVKLGDLNTGRFFNSDTTSTQSLAGTPCYMPPEKIKGQRYDFKSDIWSLGCLLYEMAALERPFQSPELIKKIEDCDYPPIPSIYTSPMTDLIAACLNPDPKERLSIEFVHTTALGFGTR